MARYLWNFDTSIVRCEVPVGLDVVCISVTHPSRDFPDEGLFVGNSPVEALGRQNAELGLRQIEPAAALLECSVNSKRSTGRLAS